MHLQTTLKIDKDFCNSPNLADLLSSQDLQTIGEEVWAGYDRDKQSRSGWEQRTSRAMDLAMQVQSGKNFPWPNCSNVAFPLVTIATMQFHSRAYPALINGMDLVKCRVMGEGPGSLRKERADRISQHMSYQLLEQDQAWEEQQDKLLINIPIVGCAFKKSFFSASQGHNLSELVLAQDLVMDYYAKSVESCQRKTHVLSLSRNDCYERIMRGSYRDVTKMGWYSGCAAPLQQDTQDLHRDKRQGTSQPDVDHTTPYRILEQHCYLDLDDDGYSEPYIVTIEETSRCVLRIVSRFRWEGIEKTNKGDIISIQAEESFTKYGFIPAPDGGIYDVGFGMLLGPLNESVNTGINMLFDAGTMATTAGGFLGRGVKIRGGQYTFAPLEWKRLDSTGEDIAKNVYPLPVREPSPVLFQLLELLINYTNRIAGVTDTQVGENPGQNTPASSMQTMVEQGQKTYNAIFKRIWRSMKQEFKLLYLLNGINLPPKTTFGEGGTQYILREDYLGNPGDIVPAADPNLTTDSMRYQQALLIKQSAQTTPGYDSDAVEINWLKAMRVDGYQAFFPGSKGQAPRPDPKVILEQIKSQRKEMELKYHMAEVMQGIQADMEKNMATIQLIQAETVAVMANVGAEKAKHQLNVLNAQLVAAKQRDDALKGHLELIMKGLESDNKRGGVPGMVSPTGDTSAVGDVSTVID